jgi:hypothetical protein
MAGGQWVFEKEVNTKTFGACGRGDILCSNRHRAFTLLSYAAKQSDWGLPPQAQKRVLKENKPIEF